MGKNWDYVPTIESKLTPDVKRSLRAERRRMSNEQILEAVPELLAALQYVADLTGAALTKEQAQTLGKRCRAAISLVKGGA